jgi:chromosome segregation ATPase
LRIIDETIHSVRFVSSDELLVYQTKVEWMQKYQTFEQDLLSTFEQAGQQLKSIMEQLQVYIIDYKLIENVEHCYDAYLKWHQDFEVFEEQRKEWGSTIQEAKGKAQLLSDLADLLQAAERLHDKLQQLSDKDRSSFQDQQKELNADTLSLFENDNVSREDIRTLVNRHQELIQQINEFVGQYRRQFEAEKRKWAQFLQQLLREQITLQTIYSEEEEQASYERLYQEINSQWQASLNKLKAQLEKTRTEILYVRDWLRKEDRELDRSVEEVTAYLEKLEGFQQISVTIEDATKWSGSFEIEIPAIRQHLVRCNMALRQYLQPERLEQKEEQLLSLFPEEQEIDLKGLVLRYMANHESLDREKVLQLVIDLFSKNHVDITLKKR